MLCPCTMEDDEKIAARLYCTVDLAGVGARVHLDGDQAHYLRAVLRLGPDDGVALFNGRHGEWVAKIDALGKSGAALTLRSQIRAQTDEGDLWLLFAPIKRQRIDWLVEKATELGVSRLVPVITARTIIGRVNLDRLQAHAREAAEQTERLTVPCVEPPIGLAPCLAALPADRTLLHCAERADVPSLGTAIARLHAAGQSRWAVLIGPEGGFTPDEMDLIARYRTVHPVSLGPRILRAETAALAALTMVQGLVGDWDRGRS